MNELEKLFEHLRRNPETHLGLGDIRLTLAQQEEIAKTYGVNYTAEIKPSKTLWRNGAYTPRQKFPKGNVNGT